MVLSKDHYNEIIVAKYRLKKVSNLKCECFVLDPLLDLKNPLDNDGRTERMISYGDKKHRVETRGTTESFKQSLLIH